MSQEHIEDLARHRQAVSIAVALVGSLLVFFAFGGTTSGSGTVFAAAALALGLWIGMQLALHWLITGAGGLSDATDAE